MFWLNIAISFSFLIFNYLHSCMSRCIGDVPVSEVEGGGQKRELNLLELELQLPDVHDGNLTQVFFKSSACT